MTLHREQFALAWPPIGVCLALLTLVAAAFVIVEPLIASAIAAVLLLGGVAVLRPEWIVYSLILTLPFQGIFVIAQGANLKMSELLGCILIIGILVRWLAGKERIMAEPVLTVPLLAFLTLILFSTLNTPRFRPEMTLNQFMPPGIGRNSPDTRSYITALWGVYCAMLLFSLPVALRTKASLGRAFAMLVWSGGVAAAFGVFQYIYLLRSGVLFPFPGSTQHLNVVHSVAGGFPRSPSSFIEPSVFAFFLVTILPITLAIAVGPFAHIMNRKLALGIFLLDCVALLLSFAVSGYVMFLAVLLLFAYWTTLRGEKSPRRRIVRRGIVAIVIMLVIVSLLQFVGVYPADVGEFVEQRLLGNADSAQIRFGLGMVALQMAAAHFVTGVGIGNYPFLAMNYEAAHTVTLVEFMVPTPSNLFLLFLAEIGIPGTLVFGWLLIRVARFLAGMSRRFAGEMRLLNAGLCASLAGGLLSFVFLDNLFVNYLWVILGLAIAMNRLLRSESVSAPPYHLA